MSLQAGSRIGPYDVIAPIWLTPDGERFAFSYRRCLSDLYLVT